MHRIALFLLLGTFGLGMGEKPLAKIVYTQIPVAASGQAEAVLATPLGELPPGSRLVVLDPAVDAEPVPLVTGFASAGFADVSFDGKRVLFVGKKTPGAPYHVWEVGIDGGGLRRVTPESDVNVAGRRPVYLSTTFTLDAEAPVFLLSFARNEDGGTLYTCRLDGSRQERITFSPYGATHPCLLSDGRLVICEGFPVMDPGASPQGLRSTALLTINTDGTELFAFAALHEPPAIRHSPCETPDGRIVYIEASFDNSDCGGAIVSVLRTRSLHSRRVIANDPNGRFRTPWPVGKDALLASYRANKDSSYGLWIVDRNSGTRTRRVVDDPRWHELGAVTLAPRPVPAGRSSIVDPTRDYGQFYCLDSYRSDRPEIASVRPGQISKVRFIRGLPDARRAGAPADSATHATPLLPEEVLGEIPVEADGSFFVDVPPEVPLRMETLDADGNVLMSMKRWLWVMPREGRGCIGCHEDREMVPPNFHPAALRNPAHVLTIDQ